MSTVARVSLGTLGLVGLSTAALPYVSGYGTILFQIVVLNAWGIVARGASETYADHHHGIVWIVALFLNLVIFGIPAIVLQWALARRRTLTRVVGIVPWTTFYLASLSVLFPATDGP